MSRFWSGLCALLAASGGAILIQPPLFLLWMILVKGVAVTLGAGELALASLLVVMVATPFVVVLGLPAFLVLRRLGRSRIAETAAAGLVLAIAPLAILNWPARRYGATFSANGNWHGHHVDFFINGEPTLYGWLQFAGGLLQFGVHGLVGALVFRAIWLWLAEGTPRSGTLGSTPA